MYLVALSVESIKTPLQGLELLQTQQRQCDLCGVYTFPKSRTPSNSRAYNSRSILISDTLTVQSVDQEVLKQVAAWLHEGHRCWLATVVATYGSSPRPEGSVMTCNPDGRVVGSLSGGCVEDDLLEKLTKGTLAKSNPQFLRYGETAEEAEQLGLPCGGHLDLVVEPLEPSASNTQTFSIIATHLEARQCITRRADFTTNKVSIETTSSYMPFSFDHERNLLCQTFGPRYQLFIVGTGMVSNYVAELAQVLDYQVTVIDPREDRLDDIDIDGVTKVCAMPDDVILARANDSQSAIVALSHDPRIDDMGLMGAFETAAFYIGAMGSSRTTAKRRARLLELDISSEQLERLHAPIGIPIGSKTPPEIAISIMAEITAVRNEIGLARLGADGESELVSSI